MVESAYESWSNLFSNFEKKNGVQALANLLLKKKFFQNFQKWQKMRNNDVFVEILDFFPKFENRLLQLSYALSNVKKY